MARKTKTEELFEVEPESIQGLEIKPDPKTVPVLAEDNTEAEWTDTVMLEFEDNEIFKGRPKCDGMLRVANKLIGTVVKSTSHIFHIPNIVKTHGGVVIEGSAVVQHTFTVLLHDSTQYKEVTGIGEVNNLNLTDDNFKPFAVSIADTRAKARALKEILGLTNVCAAEEVMPDSDAGRQFDSGKINATQKNLITTLCERNEINLTKLIGKDGHKRLDDLTYVQAKGYAKLLNEIQRGKAETPKGVSL
jgi:hypothetical protein